MYTVLIFTRLSDFCFCVIYTITIDYFLSENRSSVKNNIKSTTL